jgi:hypothetical protein
MCLGNRNERRSSREQRAVSGGLRRWPWRSVATRWPWLIVWRRRSRRLRRIASRLSVKSLRVSPEFGGTEDPNLPPSHNLRKDLWSWGFLTAPLAFSLAFFITPLAYLFYVSVHEPSPREIYGTGLTLANYAKVLSDPLVNLDRRYHEAAQSLGASPVRISSSSAVSATTVSSPSAATIIACPIAPAVSSTSSSCPT